MATTRTEQITDIGVRLFKAFINKYWYPSLTRRLDAEDLTCLNYSYEEDPPMGLSLAASDEPNQFGIQLYHLVATQADLNGKQVLDVSCGHGGGASYLVRTLHPASCTGLDFNPDGIDSCRRRHDLPGLDFVHGDAESLPFADESFDAVINVEASHAYPRLSRFLAEVVCVLRAGGRFLYADFRGRSEFPGWRQHWPTPRCGRFRNMSSIRRFCAGWRKFAAVTGHDRSPDAGVYATFGRRFAGLPGTGLYRAIQSGKLSTGCTASPRIERRPLTQGQRPGPGFGESPPDRRQAIA